MTAAASGHVPGGKCGGLGQYVPPSNTVASASPQPPRRPRADFLTPPREEGGEIRCFFRDPDGHLFEISQYG